MDSLDNSHLILQIATGMGKTKACLDKIAGWVRQKPQEILIFAPKKTVIKSWEEEIRKWHYEWLRKYITLACYNSFHKYEGFKGIVILDEGHHLTERCRLIMRTFTVSHLMVLSATLPFEVRGWLRANYRGIKTVEVDLPEAIEDGVLAEPEIILISLELDETKADHIMENAAKKGFEHLPIKTFLYRDRWSAKKYKGKSQVRCTQAQQYRDMASTIEWLKQHNNKPSLMRKSIERLQWLATEKHRHIETILSMLGKSRALLFTPSVDECNSYGIACINSKKGEKANDAVMDRFNSKKVNVLSAVGMVDEGCNLAECQYGIFQMINSSERLNIQRLGRILRHKKPRIIYPYWKDTREEEIINDVVASIKKCKVVTMKDLKEYVK